MEGGVRGFSLCARGRPLPSPPVAFVISKGIMWYESRRQVVRYGYGDRRHHVQERQMSRVSTESENGDLLRTARDRFNLQNFKGMGVGSFLLHILSIALQVVTDVSSPVVSPGDLVHDFTLTWRSSSSCLLTRPLWTELGISQAPTSYIRHKCGEELWGVVRGSWQVTELERCPWMLAFPYASWVPPPGRHWTLNVEEL